MKYINPFTGSAAVLTDNALEDSNGHHFPKIDGVCVVLENPDNYTENFGFQWNKFQKTQIDREHNTLSLSEQRFFLETKWPKGQLQNQCILEVGSGAGRFSRVVLEHTKARLYSLDFSSAVKANWRNNAQFGIDRFVLFQASVYEMPFENNQFDKVFCLGVLQHTPNFKKSVQSLIDKCKPGGEVVVDFYPVNGFWTKIHAKYLLRPLTKKMNHEKLLYLIDRHADRLIKAYRFLEKTGLRTLTRFLPVVDLKTLPGGLPYEQFRDWVVLDTFDMFSPMYDNPQRISTVKNWFEENGMTVSFAGYEKSEDGFIRCAVVRGIKA